MRDWRGRSVQLREVVRQKSGRSVIGGSGQFGQDPGDVVFRIDADEPAGADHAVDHRRAPPGVGMANEQVVA